MVNRTATATALLLLASLLAIAPAASASHTRCDNEASDTWVALPAVSPGFGVGVDGPLFDHNGLQACVDDNVFSVETTTDPLGTDGPIPPPAGSGFAARVCTNEGTADDECEGVIVLGWTGVTVACTTPNSVCVWVHGIRVVPL